MDDQIGTASEAVLLGRYENTITAVQEAIDAYQDLKVVCQVEHAIISQHYEDWILDYNLWLLLNGEDEVDPANPFPNPLQE